MNSGYLQFLAQEVGYPKDNEYTPFNEFEKAFNTYYTHVLVQEFAYHEQDNIISCNIQNIGVYDNINTMARYCRKWLHEQLHNYIDISNNVVEKQSDYYSYITCDFLGGNELNITVYPTKILHLDTTKLENKILKITFIEFNQVSPQPADEGILWRIPRITR